MESDEQLRPAMTYLGGIAAPFAGPSGLTASPLIVLLIAFGLGLHAEAEVVEQRLGNPTFWGHCVGTNSRSHR